MSRLARFDNYRFIGVRHTMRVYDCDDTDQFEALEGMVTLADLLKRNLLQAFAPDTLDEAVNRGFRAPVGNSPG